MYVYVKCSNLHNSIYQFTEYIRDDIQILYIEIHFL